MSTTYKLALGASVGVTTLIGLFSVMPGVLAATSSSTKNAVVTVGASCSMNSTVSTAHTATIAQGNYNKGIGLTEVTTTCNDAGGYAIYAVGYGDDTLGNNVLHSAAVGSTYDIATGNDFANATTSYSSNTSQWAMRVETVPGQTDSPTITNNFDSLSLVPTTYTKVAQYNANTSTPSTSSITTEYGAYIAIGQPAGTYTGKVKYTLVHPSTEPAPKVPPVSCSKSVPNISYMQEINSSNKATILNSLTEGEAYYLRDSRDEEFYCVSKLADGNLWMLDNLRLDLTDSTILNTLSSTNTNINSATETVTLTSLKSGNRSAGDQYATAGVGNLRTTGNSNSVPLVNTNYKDYIDSYSIRNYGDGSYKYGVYYNICAASAGSYCYGNDASEGTPSGNANEDICPAGWRMPTGGSSGEYQTLFTAYNSNQTGTDTGSLQYNLSTPLSGYIYHKSFSTQGTSGFFWSSTGYGSSYMYILHIASSYVTTQEYDYRGVGSSVRCLLQ